jgi:hypothetical protein
MYTRREFGAIGLVAIPFGRVCAAHGITFNGVQIGVQSSCFTGSGMSIDAIIKLVTGLGFGEIGVMSEHIENYLGAPVQLPGAGRQAQPASAHPPDGAPAPARSGASGPGRGRGIDPAARAALRKWRLEAELDKYRAVGKLFQGASLKLYCYGLTFDDTFTDEEIDKGFQATKALGTQMIYASSTVAVLPRVAPFAEKHGVIVALHNHTLGPDDFAKAVAISEKIRVNLDVGHFFASGYDPIAYIREHHDLITHIHLKDRKKNQGPEMAFGQGDTPLREILVLMKQEKYNFPAYIEYVGTDGQEIELKRCLDFCRQALA